MARAKKDSKLKVISLGGLGEIGKNMTVLEYENDIIVVDCGLGFPDDDMLGVDLVIPDVSYLEKNIDKVRINFKVATTLRLVNDSVATTKGAANNVSFELVSADGSTVPGGNGGGGNTGGEEENPLG